MKTALLIIDVQKATLRPHAPNLSAKIEKLQQNYPHIFISRFINRASPLLRILNWEGYKNEELSFVPAPNAVIFDKNIYSSFIPALLEFDNVDICGCDTEACIYKTALDLIEHNIRPRVLADYCSSLTPELHQSGIQILQRNIGIHNIFFGEYGKI